MDRRKRGVRIVLEKLFGVLPVKQNCDDHRSHSDSSTLDSRAASADGRIGHDVGMCYRRHNESLANLLLPCNPLLIESRQRNGARHAGYHARALGPIGSWISRAGT